MLECLEVPTSLLCTFLFSAPLVRPYHVMAAVVTARLSISDRPFSVGACIRT